MGLMLPLLSNAHIDYASSKACLSYARQELGREYVGLRDAYLRIVGYLGREGEAERVGGD